MLFLGQIWPFLDQQFDFLREVWRGSKSFGTLITENHLGPCSHCFSVGQRIKWPKNADIWTKMTDWIMMMNNFSLGLYLMITFKNCTNTQDPTNFSFLYFKLARKQRNRANQNETPLAQQKIKRLQHKSLFSSENRFASIMIASVVFIKAHS